MKNFNFEEYFKYLKQDIGEGYFISNINEQGSYFYYDYKSKKFKILFTSNRLKSDDIKLLFEKSGRKTTIKNPSNENNLILGTFKSYVESDREYILDKNPKIYKVEEHQLEHAFEQSYKLSKSGLLQNFNINEIRKSRNFEYKKHTAKAKIKQKL